MQRFNVLRYVSIIVFLVYIVINIVLIIKNKKFNKSREFIKFMFLVYFMCVIGLTINMTSNGIAKVKVANVIPLVESFKMLTQGNLRVVLHQLVGNFIMLVPLGMFLGALYKKCDKPLKIAGIAFICSLMIEANQYYNGRFADIDDIILNTSGAVVGYLIYKLLIEHVKKIKVFKTIFDNSQNGSSPVKGILMLVIPTFILIQVGYKVEYDLHIENNSIEIATIYENIEVKDEEVIAELGGRMLKNYITTDGNGGYYNYEFYEENGHLFPNRDYKINGEEANYAYKDDKGNFVIIDYLEGGKKHELLSGNFLVKAPVGSKVTFSNGDKKVSMDMTEEVVFNSLFLDELGLSFEESNKMKITIEK
ncbi:MAG: VanZ family protein [Sarcina sp.]